jgi:hypothetical protein
MKKIDEAIKIQRKLELQKLGENLRLNTRINPIMTRPYIKKIKVNKSNELR